MAHIHSVFDTDAHFKIDAITRAIKNVSANKRTIVQTDHNSERFSFELPRFIEGHDMAECNKVYVNFNNISTSAKEHHEDRYTVDDLQISSEDENVVVCSWLISKYATQFAGLLSFNLSFRCMTDDVIDYSWNTAIYSEFYVMAGMDAAASVATEYSDVLEKWKAELFAAGYINAEDMRSDIAALKSGLAVEKSRVDLLSNYVTPQMFGAKGDGVTDDTAAINNCLASHKRVYLPEGVYIINPKISLIMRDDQTMELSENAVISAAVADETVYNYAITIKDVSNVTIHGGKICGDRIAYPESTKERGYGIFICNSKNVCVDGCEVSDFRGDCIIMESYKTPYPANVTEYDDFANSNIRISNCRIHNALRHGITVMGVRGLTVKDTEIYNTQGKDYSTAIDAEVHYEWQEMSDFRYENVRAYDCNNGVMFNQNDWKGTISGVSVERCNFDRIQLGVAGSVDINWSNIRIISVGSLDSFIATHCNIGQCYITHKAKKVTVNKCVFDCTEDFPEAFTFQYSAETSTVECEVNDCVINSYASDVKDNLKNLFAIQCQPVKLIMNGCTLYVNNPNGVKLTAQNAVKVFGCKIINKFTQNGYPSAILSVSAAENYIVGNVFDTTEASATNNDKCIIESSRGNMFFANNVGVMAEIFGVLLSFSAGDSGRTWTIMNNVFPKYAGKGQTASGVTYVDVGNIYSGTT